MKENIRTIAIIGANGTIGALTGGLFAQCGFNVYFISRTIEKSRVGMQKAFHQARSEIIGKNIICSDYNEIGSILQKSDWIIECVKEDFLIKKEMYEVVEKYRKKESIVSSMTSSLPLSKLSEGRSDHFKSKFVGFHLFNPPGKLSLCEIAPIKETDKETIEIVSEIAQKNLYRNVVPVCNIPGYAGNRIGFKFFSDITKEMNAYSIEMIDYLLGPYTGRAMAPLATLDLVGIDTHRAIIQSLIENTSEEKKGAFIIPDFIHTLVETGHWGNKTPDKGGFYRRDYNHSKSTLQIKTLTYASCLNDKISFVEQAKHCIREGRYQEAFSGMKKAQGKEADFVRKMLCSYVAYSFSCIGEVTKKEYGIQGINKAMACGFNWAPPTVIMQLFGGKEEIIGYCQEYALSIPDSLQEYSIQAHFIPSDGRFFLAR